MSNEHAVSDGKLKIEVELLTYHASETGIKIEVVEKKYAHLFVLSSDDQGRTKMSLRDFP